MAHGGPMPPPSGLSKHKTRRFTARLAHVATPTQRTSLYESLLHVLHKTLESAAPLDSSVAVSQRLIPKGKWLPPYDESPELQSCCQTFCVVMVVSDGLRSTLISSKFI